PVDFWSCARVRTSTDDRDTRARIALSSAPGAGLAPPETALIDGVCMRRALISTGFITLSTLVLATSASAHQTIVSSSRRLSWSSAGVAGGIPTNRTTNCATLNPGATAAQISSAIASCPAGQVVFLNAGTYNITGIDFGGGKSNVTLRGAGADQTFLIFSDD